MREIKAPVPFAFERGIQARIDGSPKFKAHYYNVLITAKGHITSMPFDTKREGVWYFDGQFYYQKRG